MKVTTLSLLAITLLTGISFAAMTPQEINNLRRQNNNKVTELRRNLQQIAGKEKAVRDEAFISSNLTEIVKLVKHPEAASTIISESGAYLDAARAYSRPLNLRYYNEAKKYYLGAIQCAATPMDKANASVEYGKYACDAAMEGTTAEWNKYILDAYNTQGLNTSEKLTLLKGDIPGLDFEEEGDKITKGDRPVRWNYYSELLRRIRKYNVYGNSTLDPKKSNEYFLEICNRILADKDMTDGEYWSAKTEKVFALKNLERYDEAEKLLIEMSLQKYNSDKAIMALGDYYVEMAYRYYADYDKELLKKAILAYSTVSEKSKEYSLRKIADALFLSKDYDGVIKAVEERISLLKDKKATIDDNRLLANAYFYKEDYANAVKYYDLFNDNNVDLQDRYARALYAVGRYEDAIAHIKRSYNNWSYREANKYFIRKIEAKMKELGIEPSKPAEEKK